MTSAADADPGTPAVDAAAGPEFVDLATVGPPAFREDEYGVPTGQQFSDVPKRLPRSRFPLRQRERIEEERR